MLPDANALTSEFRPDLLNGVQVIKGQVIGLSPDASDNVKRADRPFMAIPYATWANRGRGQMTVWLARTDAAARPTPYPTVATTSTVTASTPASGRGKNTRPISDGEEPRNSSDAGACFDWWPTRGSQLEWIREGPLEQSDVQAGDHDRAASRSDDAAGVLGGIAGMEG